MDQTTYASAERKLLEEWTGKWLGLIDLINNVTGTDQPPWSPPPPAEIDEISYQSLRFWFMDHEAQFLPLWKEFYESRDWYPAEPKDNDEEDLPQKYLGNSFLFFYEPENLYHLAQQLDLQSGVDIWEPSEYGREWLDPSLFGWGSSC